MVVVVGAGNNAQSGNPVNCIGVPGALVVGSIQQDGTVAPFSEDNSTVSVVAPGAGIEVPGAGGTYTTGDGTSFAAPWVSAEAALLIAEHPAWTSGQIVATIIGTTTAHTPASG